MHELPRMNTDDTDEEACEGANILKKLLGSGGFKLAEVGRWLVVAAINIRVVGLILGFVLARTSSFWIGNLDVRSKLRSDHHRARVAGCRRGEGSVRLAG
jgi:hypothetical protein